jgi:hypothetical protein
MPRGADTRPGSDPGPAISPSSSPRRSNARTAPESTDALVTYSTPDRSRAIPSGWSNGGGSATPNAVIGVPAVLSHCTRWLSRSVT